MKNLIAIISFMLIITNSYSYNSGPMQGLSIRKNMHEISDIKYKDNPDSNKSVKVKPGKALKNKKIVKDKADSLKYEKDNSGETYLKDSAAAVDSINRVYSDSAVFIKAVKNKPLKAYTKSECTVMTLSGKIYNDVRISGMNDSSMNILKNNKSKSLLLKDISSIKIKGRGFWKGALVGAGGALLLGFIAGNLDTTGDYLWDGMKIGIALALPLAIVGGIFESKDTVYDMRAMDISMKKKQVKYLLRYY